MAIEKMLNTRIALKIDTLENWSKSQIGLKRGELALATVAASAGTGLEEPVIMIKVGEDGVKTFSQLSWNVYAKASDVLDTCKSTDKLTAFVNAVIADAGIATDEAVQGLANRVGGVETAIGVLNGNDETAGSVAKAIKDAIDALDLANTYAAKEHEHVAADITDLDATIKGYDYATKTELGEVDAKFADYKTAQDQKAIDDEQDRRLGVIEGDYLKAADIADFETKENVKKVADDLAAYVESNDAAVDLKVDKSVVDAMYTNDAIDTAVQGAKDYAKGLVDAIPAQTDYSVTVTSREDAEGDDHSAFKHYIFEQCGEEIGHIDIPRDLVVSSGSVGTVTEADKPYAGAVVGDKYIELVIANQTEHLFVPAKDLVDIYTAKADATQVQIAISNTNEISAVLVDGGVTEAKLHADVATKLNKVWEEVGVAASLVDALANGQVKTNKEAIEAINNETTGILAKAKEHANGLNSAMDARVATLEAIDHEAYVAADATLKSELQGEIAAAKTDATNQAVTVLAEAQAYADSLAANYATAEQGAKADTAVQEVTSVANNGIKVTTTGNSVSIDWDNDVVFVFDCGTSGVVAEPEA